MKIRHYLAAVAIAAISVNAAGAQAAETGKWTVTVTPRYQHVFFKLPDSEGSQSMATFGGTIAVREPSQRWGFAGTFLTGTKNNGQYVLDGTTDIYDFRVKRQEVQLSGEFTPSDTGITLLGGYHRYDFRQDETLKNPRPGRAETNSFRFTLDAAEIGLRLASRLGADSAQSISAQFLFGIGSGKFRDDTNFNNIVANGDQSGTGYAADVALGYNIFVTDNLSLGARARGYVFYVDVDRSDPVFALIPELNLSFRF
jgi:hypothetical protein